MQKQCSCCGAWNQPQANNCSTCGAAFPSLPTYAGTAPPTVGLASGGAPTLVASSGQVFTLTLAVHTIGREACDIMITADVRVSRRHARIEQTASGWQIVDLNSSNGTSVHGLRLTGGQPCPLAPGTVIVVGDTQLTFDPQTGPPGYPVPGTAPPAGPSMPPSFSAGWPRSSGTGASAIQWQQWPHPPQVEGEVTYIDPSPRMEQKSILGKVALAGVLAIIFAPLAFLPFMTRSEVSVRDMRIQDRHTGQSIGVRIRGDMIGGINIGDAVAVWARAERGVLEMFQAHNYTTGQPVNVKC